MKKLLLLVFPAFLFFGCGVWADFTTYFNLYYNTSDLFDQVQSDIKKQNTDIFSIEEKPLPSSANANITKIIEKCSQILQFHANSGFVGDALIMLGKCFYYQGNYQKAVRKFNELLATNPKPDVQIEADLWMGMTQMKMSDYDNGLATLKAVIEKGKAEGNRSVVESAYIEEIKYRILQKDYPGAITLLDSFLQVSKNDETNAQAAFELGNLYVKQGDLPNAIKSYQNVKEYSPTYDVLVNSQIELGKAYRENNEYDKSVSVLNALRSQAKFKDAFDRIEVQRGITYKYMNKIPDAVSRLIIVDTTYLRTPSAGLAELELAKIFENNYRNLDSALYYYNKSLVNSVPADSVKEIRNKVDLITKYKNTAINLARTQKQIGYIKNPEEFIKDSVAYVDKIIEQRDKMLLSGGDTTQNIQQQNQRRTFLPNQNQNTVVQNGLEAPQRPTISLDSLNNNLIRMKFDLGSLLFTDFNMPDSAYLYFSDVLQNYPNSKYEARALFAMGSYYLIENDSVKADSLFNIIYDNYKNESIVNAAADKLNKPLINFNYDPVEPIYAEAEKQLENKNYDSSLTSFYKIFQNHPKSSYAAKALYASGWILENKLNLSDSAAVVYDTLSSEYPQSIYSESVKSKLMFYKMEHSKKLSTDSLKGNIAVSDSLKAKKTANIAADVPLTPKVNVKSAAENRELADRRISEEALKIQEEARPDTLIRIIKRFSKK